MKGITSLLTILLPRDCVSILSDTLYETPVLLNSLLTVISTCCASDTISFLERETSTSPIPLSADPNPGTPPAAAEALVTSDRPLMRLCAAGSREDISSKAPLEIIIV